MPAGFEGDRRPRVLAKPYISWASSTAVRSVMLANPKRDTLPERRLRSALHRRGLRFRVTSRVEPDIKVVVDIVFAGSQVAVFVDGCYWHGCPAHGTTPRTNPEYWIPKIERTRRRDELNDQLLREAGWEPIHIWEHQPVEAAAERVAAAVQIRSSLNRLGRSGSR
jgi:DNA mismatch endonuclease (patch repair protein)